MRLEYMLLADKAEAINGKLYLLGGGLDTVRLLTIPSLASYDIVLSVKVTREEAGEHHFQLTLEDSSGAPVFGPIQSTLTATAPSEGPESRVLLVVSGPFPVGAPGTFAWRLRVDDADVAMAPVTYLTTGLTEEQLQELKVGSIAPGTPPEQAESSSGSTAPE